MPPDTFLYAANHIFEATHVVAGKDQHSRTRHMHTAVNELLRGENGPGAQTILLEVAIALKRRQALAKFLHMVATSLDELRTQAFMMNDAFGHRAHVSYALEQKLSGQEGLIERFSKEYRQIKTNAAHIDREESEDRLRYWRPRLKDYVRRLNDELTHYGHAVIAANESTARIVNNTASHAMNEALGAKQQAEWQQTTLITAKTDSTTLTSIDLGVVHVPQLCEFLVVAADQADATTFALHLHALLQREPRLVVFEDTYVSMQAVTGMTWQGTQSVLSRLKASLTTMIMKCQQQLKTTIIAEQFMELPLELPLHELLAPINTITQASIDDLRVVVEEWRRVATANRQQIVAELQSE